MVAELIIYSMGLICLTDQHIGIGFDFGKSLSLKYRYVLKLDINIQVNHVILRGCLKNQGCCKKALSVYAVTRNLRDVYLPCYDPYYGEAIGITFDLS